MMDAQTALTLAFGLPTLGLVAKIYFMLGGQERALNELEKDISALWREVNKLRDRFINQHHLEVSE